MARTPAAPPGASAAPAPTAPLAAASDQVAGATAWWAVALLSLLYVFSTVDRMILALLIGPIKVAFHVADIQIGLLFGPAFAFFYAFMGLPMARIADRGNRRYLITAAVLIWATCTLASSLATAFLMLVVLRIGLAIGEAALSPAAHSMIGDLFPPRRRMFAASLYSAAGMAGSAGAALLGALVLTIAAQVARDGAAPGGDWRVVFLVAGAPALLLGIVFALTVREPPRKPTERHVAALKDVFAMILRKPRLYLCMLLGVGFTQVVPFAFAAWTPEFLKREFHWTIAQAGVGYGVINIVAGVAGTVLTPFLGRALERAGRRDGILLASIVTVLAGGLLSVLAPMQHSPFAFLGIYAVGYGCLQGTANNIIVAQQVTAPDRMRGTMVALLVMSLTLIGQGFGPPLVPYLAGALPMLHGRLGGAMTLTAALGVVPPVLLYLLALKPYRAMAERGWENAARD